MVMARVRPAVLAVQYRVIAAACQGTREPGLASQEKAITGGARSQSYAGVLGAGLGIIGFLAPAAVDLVPPCVNRAAGTATIPIGGAWRLPVGG